MTSNPFLRKTKDSYEGSSGIEYLMNKAMPHILVRANTRIPCSCASTTAGTGKDNCAKCFGTGFVVDYLDKIQCFISSPVPDTSNLTTAGYTNADRKKIYTGRWVYPTEQQLLLEVGWNTVKKDILLKGRPTVVHNVYELRYVTYPGLTEPAYAQCYSILTNKRKRVIENLLLFSEEIAPYRVVTSSGIVNGNEYIPQVTSLPGEFDSAKFDRDLWGR